MINFEELETQGYLNISNKSNKDILYIAKALGVPIPSRKKAKLIDTLKPIPKNKAYPYSMSAQYGINSLPFHTDGAYLKIPPKYIVLKYISGSENPTPTTFINIEENINRELLEALKYYTWLVKGQNRSFYSPIANTNLIPKETIYRFDICCMKPAFSDDTFFENFNQIIIKSNKNKITWNPNKVLILNNWKFLHSRPQIKKEEILTRTIERIFVK